MKNLTLSLLTAALLAGGASVGGAQAAPLGGNEHVSFAAQALVEKTQFYYGGREYCWYPGGWHGPGYYWCGYAYRRGLGWGGGYGWRGWGPGYRGGEHRGREFRGAGGRHH